MWNFSLLILGIVAIILQMKPLMAQSPNFRFEHIKIEDRISDVRVPAILQDRRGFMWFGSQDGLIRFDGYEYKTYYHEPADSTSISGNNIEELYEDSRGNIWVGIRQSGIGICRYDPSTDAFVRYAPDSNNSSASIMTDVQSIYESSDGYVWFGSFNGLDRYDPETEVFTHFRYDPNDSTSLDHISGIFLIYEDSRANLWVGAGFITHSAGGLHLYHPETGTFTRFQHDPNDPNTLRSSAVLTAYEDSKGNFWVGSFGDGLHLMDRETGIFTHFPYNPQNDRRDLLSRQSVATKTAVSELPFQPSNLPDTSMMPLSDSDPTRVHILVVDDEPINQQVLKNHLASGKFRITQAMNGEEALQLLSQTQVENHSEKPVVDSDPPPPFDLVLLDVMMPRMSGYEVCQKIRERYLPSELSVIMITAKDQLQDIVQGLDLGANDYLPKPFHKEELLARIRTQLDLSKIFEVAGRFVPNDFLHSLDKERLTDVHLGDYTEWEVTVLFSDIRGYTALAESMTPEENFKFVNAFHGRMGPIIQRHNGFVNQYLLEGVPDDWTGVEKMTSK